MKSKSHLKKFLYNNIDYKDAYLIHFQTIQVYKKQTKYFSLQ